MFALCQRFLSWPLAVFIGSTIGQKQFSVAQEISIKSGVPYLPPTTVCLWCFKLKKKSKNGNYSTVWRIMWAYYTHNFSSTWVGIWWDTVYRPCLCASKWRRLRNIALCCGTYRRNCFTSWKSVHNWNQCSITRVLNTFFLRCVARSSVIIVVL
jgi:hypothetical protein